MYRILLSLVVFAGCAAAIAAQETPSAKPNPTPEDIVKISTSLVQFDVSVTDKNGVPIRDLRPEEVHIFENGKEQKVSGLSFVAGAVAVEKTSASNADRRKEAPPLLPGKKLAPNEVRRTIAIVVDDITLSFESIAYVKTVLRKFVDEQMQDGDLVAIVTSGSGVGAFQQFTTDKRQLHLAIDHIRWNAAANGRIGAFSPIGAKLDSPQPAAIESAEPIESRRTLDEIQQENSDLRQNIFAAGSLGALNYVIRGMGDLPGRKSVLMLSEGFSLFEREEGGHKTQGRIIDAIRTITDTANRAAVVVYTLDPRGLQVPMLSAEDNTDWWSAEELSAKVERRGEDLLDTQDGLRYLAEETGGIAIINQNNLGKGIRRILDDQSYYLVAYEPDDESFDPQKVRFNKISVKVDRPGAKVRYRRGFFNIEDNAMAKVHASTGNEAVSNAIFSPFTKNDLPIRFNALFRYDPKAGSFVRSLAHLNVADLDFKKDADGKMKAAFDVYAFAFGERGQVAAQLQKGYTITVTPENYEKMRSTGFVYDFVFPFEKPGAYQLRIVVRDRSTQKVGSASQFVEIPNIKKERLTLAGVVLDAGGENSAENPLTSTAVREFRAGSRVDYGSVVYNAKTDSAGNTNLKSRLRVFRDGVLIFEGQPQTINRDGQPANAVAFMGSLSFGNQLAAGDYVMEISVTDELAKEKNATALQYVEFAVTG